MANIAASGTPNSDMADPQQNNGHAKRELRGSLFRALSHLRGAIIISVDREVAVCAPYT